MAWKDREEALNIEFTWVHKVADVKVSDEKIIGKSSSETGTKENFISTSIYHF